MKQKQSFSPTQSPSERKYASSFCQEQGYFFSTIVKKFYGGPVSVVKNRICNEIYPILHIMSGPRAQEGCFSGGCDPTRRRSTRAPEVQASGRGSRGMLSREVLKITLSQTTFGAIKGIRYEIR